MKELGHPFKPELFTSILTDATLPSRRRRRGGGGGEGGMLTAH